MQSVEVKEFYLTFLDRLHIAWFLQRPKEAIASVQYLNFMLIKYCEQNLQEKEYYLLYI